MSNVQHTKAKAKTSGAEAARGGNVYPRHNKSQIGQKSASIESSISKGKTQSRPGKPIKDKKDLNFCIDCGKYVGGEVYTL